MFSIVNGGNSALCMEHQFAACGNSCRVFGELVLIEETSTLFFASDAKCFQLSVKLFSHPFLCNSQLYKKITLYTFEREKTVIPARKLGRKNDRTSHCSLTCALVHVCWHHSKHCHLLPLSL